MREKAAARLLWIVAAVFLALWLLTYVTFRLRGSYMHVFLVAAIGCALMNLIAHYWTSAEPKPDAGPKEHP